MFFLVLDAKVKMAPPNGIGIPFILPVILLLLYTPVAYTTNSSYGNLTLLTDYPTARCLDGSSSGFYLRPALNSASASKWMFMLEGGGLCSEEVITKI